MSKNFIAEAQRRIDEKNNMSQEEKFAEEVRRMKFNMNYNPTKPSNYPTLEEHKKRERIKQSATPQPVEWELANYDGMDGSWCGIENRIFVDEGESYKKHNHPLWVYLEFKNIKNKNPNGYYTCFYLPITVERYPQVIGDIEGMGINPKVIDNVKRFISGNVKWFQDVADVRIRALKVKPIPIFMLKEEKILLLEFPNFLKSETGLPVNIWIDTGSNPQHSIERIKFQNNYGDTFDENNLCTLQLFGDMEVVGNTKIRNKEVDMVRNFCRINKGYIDSYTNGRITRDDFVDKTVKLDKKGNPIPTQSSPNSTWEIKHGMTTFNISVVVSNSNKFNYLRNNKLLCNTWFDEANSFIQAEEGKIVAFARNGSTWYQVDENGGIQKYM